MVLTGNYFGLTDQRNEGERRVRDEGEVKEEKSKNSWPATDNKRSLHFSRQVSEKKKWPPVGSWNSSAYFFLFGSCIFFDFRSVYFFFSLSLSLHLLLLSEFDPQLKEKPKRKKKKTTERKKRKRTKNSFLSLSLFFWISFSAWVFQVGPRVAPRRLGKSNSKFEPSSSSFFFFGVVFFPLSSFCIFSSSACGFVVVPGLSGFHRVVMGPRQSFPLEVSSCKSCWFGSSFYWVIFFFTGFLRYFIGVSFGTTALLLRRFPNGPTLSGKSARFFWGFFFFSCSSVCVCVCECVCVCGVFFLKEDRVRNSAHWTNLWDRPIAFGFLFFFSFFFPFWADFFFGDVFLALYGVSGGRVRTKYSKRLRLFFGFFFTQKFHNHTTHCLDFFKSGCYRRTMSNSFTETNRIGTDVSVWKLRKYYQI